MKRRITWIVLTCLIATSVVLASCAKSTMTTISSSTTTTTKTATSITTKTTVTAPTTIATTATTTTTISGNWWDSLGTPQYGGEMVLRMNRDLVNFDPNAAMGQGSILDAWIERLHGDDWTLNPSVFDYKINWRPPTYVTGNLAQSYEMTDANTYVVHLRKGVQWQNIPPANGREFVASDVVAHYQRFFGLGSGITPSPYYTGLAAWKDLISATAIDNYTVVFKWKTPNPEFIMENMQALGAQNNIECPDAVQQWGNLNDWHHAIGTGPFILKDFVSGSSATLTKNPNYWAYDERYPQNRLPYVDTVNFLIIPDNATALAAMRTGKIDVMNQESLQDAQSLQKTNPAILQIPIPQSTACAVVPRDDKAPFTDIRVREALQMAINLQDIATNYYAGTCLPNPSSLTSNYMVGWGLPYDQWPQDLKDQYAYNPTSAKTLLAAAGFPNGFNTDIVVDSASDLNLLQIVKSYFAAINVNMDIRPLDTASWVAFVRTGHKNDALAMQIGGDPLGLTNTPSMMISRLQTGGSGNWAMVSDPVYDSFVAKANAATTVDNIKQVFKDVNLYVAQQHFAISLLQPTQYAFCQPWLKGYNGQANSVTGEVGSPLMCAFYSARFWVDQSLKRSVGF